MKKIAYISLAVGFFLVLGLVMGGFGEWIIDGDRVYVNDSTVYVSATPHTLTEDGWVYFNVTSKVYTGDIDAVIGVDTNSFRPTKLEYYNPDFRNVTYSYTCEGDFNYTLSPNHFWCYNSTTQDFIYERDFEWGNLSTGTAYWNISKFLSWERKTGASSIDYDYQGMDKWYSLSGIPINQDQEYFFRVHFDVDPVGINYYEDQPQNKYWFAIKRSSDTIQDAVANGRLYALDPWHQTTNKMVSYYPLNETSGNHSDVLGNSTGKYIDATYGATGVIGTAFYFFANDEIAFNGLDEVIANSSELSVCTWVNFTQVVGADETLFWDANDLAGTGFGMIKSTSGTPHLYVTNTEQGAGFSNICQNAGETTVNNTDITPNSYHYACVVVNNTGLYTYWDGSFTSRGACTTTNSWYSVHGLDTEFTVGQQNDSDSAQSLRLDAAVDEFAIWSNRSLTSSDISTLYNSGAGLWPFTLPPTIVINSPANATDNDISKTFNVTATDAGTVDLCWYSLDAGTTNITMTNTFGDFWNQTNSSMTEAQHTAQFYCNNTDGDLNDTESVIFTIDLTAPITQVQDPTNTTFGNGVRYFNATNDTEVHTWIVGYNETNITAFTINTTLDTVEDGNHQLLLWANDTSGNMGVNDSVYFTVDTTGPATTVNAPTGTITASNNITINITFSDALSDRDECRYNVTTAGDAPVVTDRTINCTTPTIYSIDYQTISDGSGYKIWTYANDTLGNTNVTTLSFNIDTAPAGPGGGGGGSPIVVGEGVTQWEMTTDTGGSKYQFNMVQGSSRSRDLLFSNIGESARTISLACTPIEGSENLCDYITFEQDQFELPLIRDFQTSIGFTIELPTSFKKGDYVVNLEAKDELGNIGIITTEVNIGTSGPVINFVTKLVSSKKVGGVPIPYFLIFGVLILIFGFASHFLVLKPNKIPGAWGFLIGLFFGIVGVVII